MEHVQNTKCMRELREKNRRKVKSLSRTEEDFYYDKHDKDSEGKAKKKPFVHSSCRLKSVLSCSDMIRKDRHVADVYAAVLTYQQNGIRLLGELKRKLSAEVTKITKEEVKGLERVRACEYYKVEYDLAGTLLLERLEHVITPKSQEMARLMHAVIAKHSVLSDDGSNLEQGETLSDLSRDVNKMVDGHLKNSPSSLT